MKTPNEMRISREGLGFTQSELAAAMRMGAHGRRRVRCWETGERNPSGATVTALELMEWIGRDEVDRYLAGRDDTAAAAKARAGRLAAWIEANGRQRED